ncbi:hypothetical protein IQ230_13815 [Gloeocapsopsis crepidinum LEGE 06123]|uniref:Uncharacterized protein n=1 Tax=Gloeocapsopsis crepidinum LEGE 06123 TaxID=588587 RepID=A0ABR9USZ1_9CHRO|nr:hypothetical protein [Gloeocapsopsis crepidinum]MBE9191403.1 hypothetical protein [Gloeocapsopsis crepidinum LEGE 06123]
MPKPFSDLEKRAIAILASGGNPANSADLELARYWQWKINPSSSAHDLPATSTRTTGRKKDPVYLLPFAVILATDVLAKVQMTRRTAAALPANVKTACGHEVLGSKSGYRFRSYKPAYVYWRTGASETSDPRTSRITGRKYKSAFTAGDEGFLAPFGKTASTDTEGAKQEAIFAAFPTPKPALITFTPEKYRA